MTLLPSPLAQSTLGEKCALYLDHVSDNIPVFWDSLRPRLDPYLTYSTSTLRSVAQALPFDVDDQISVVYAALLLGILTVAVMSWGNPFNSGFWRRSPSYTPTAPQVRDGDFSYIAPEYNVDQPSDTAYYASQYDGNLQDNEPDVICLKNRGTIYPLRFRAYAIDDGVLTVGALRQEAAKEIGVSNPVQIRLLYKGNLLKDNARPCKAVGIKQHSQVHCVVTEAGDSTPSDLSDHDSAPPREPSLHRPASSSSRLGGEDDAPGPSSSGGKKKSNKKKKKKASKRAPSQERPAPREELLGTPSLAPPRPMSSGPSGAPSPAPSLKAFKTPLEQVNALTEYLQMELIPLCDAFLADPPSDPKKREFEYRKLSEIILAQVMLKADGIEVDGLEIPRNARKALIKEAQATLNRLDEIGKQ
ncbi:hypothetical protein N7462_007267 [Penicillium macrosclerotiorum]|uniref:uncharacterized protein n=1 Tax=Penicillium macrosclerotiorum TaxID=303699 RepID=UPI002547ACFB|nr:uncharacterized protein N7462_007267 [Penicillium macrosclerotiorum]KAJ5679023.1 hypothetical protein N7462_007267 [Penicillium macrosclerotiorum]